MEPAWDRVFHTKHVTDLEERKTNLMFYYEKVYLPCKSSELHVMFFYEKSYSFLALLVVYAQYGNHQNLLTKIMLFSYLKKYNYYGYFQWLV